MTTALMIHPWIIESIRALSPRSRQLCRQCLRERNQRHATPPQPLVRRSLLHSQSGPGPEASASQIVPLRKQLKDEAKEKRAAGVFEPGKKRGRNKDPRLEKWELTVGLEIHAQLNTEKKLFSSAAASVNDIPNSHVALFDVAFPGTQPKFQTAALIPALRAATALHCNIQRTSRFDRKHYFYQDQPAGYQITQYYEPFAKDGNVTLYAHDGIAPEYGKSIRIGIKQIQMEQDTAKSLLQPPDTNLLDFNRVGHPLIEIITLPQIHNAQTAAACVRKLQGILQAVDAVTVGMEMGGLRADVNVSVRRKEGAGRDDNIHEYYGVKGLGQRTEIKNLSSFKAVEDAIIAERDRQIDVLEGGGVIEGETRGWALGSTETTRLRGKEGEVDYRYMPDPDLGPVVIGKDVLEHVVHTMQVVPDQTLEMLTTAPYYLTTKDAKTIMSLDDGSRVDYYRDVIDDVRRRMMPTDGSNFAGASATTIGKTVGNWVLHELGGLFTTSGEAWNESTVPANQLALLLAHLLQKKITGRTAKYVAATKFEGHGRDVNGIIDEEGLWLVPMRKEKYVALAQGLLNDNGDVVRQIKERGRMGKIQWFVGQMMRQGEEGRVEAEKAEAVLKELLGLTNDNR